MLVRGELHVEAGGVVGKELFTLRGGKPGYLGQDGGLEGSGWEGEVER